LGLDTSNIPPMTSPAFQPLKVRSAAWRFFVETFQTILLALVLYFLIDTVIARVRVENISMKPTLQPGEYVLVNKFAYKLGNIRHGDVIVFHYPQDPTEDYIKRVIGLPGDQIHIRNGKIFVNQQEIIESYSATTPTYDGDWIVPEGSLFVLGDNRNQSSDSHSWGFVPIKNVVGRALAVYWPLHEIKSLTPSFTIGASVN